MASKLNHKKKNQAKVDYMGEHLSAYLYVILMLGVFPLFYRNNYINIMESKFLFFSVSTLLAALCILFFFTLTLLTQFSAMKKPKNVKEWLSMYSATDLCFLILSVAVLVSWLGCDPYYRSDAWSGAQGKMAGVYMYLILVLSYVIVSRFLVYDQKILFVYIAVNFVVFGLAVLNHFRIDPLGMYSNLKASNHWMFITTMGNINVLAGYFCVFVPVIMVTFCFCKTLKSHILYGLFMTVSFMGLIAANGDAGILGTAVCFVFILWFCFDDVARLKYYFIMSTLFFAGAAVIGALDTAYADIVKEPLATFPAFVANSGVNRIMLILCLVLSAVCHFLQKKQIKEERLKMIRNLLFLLLGAGVLAGLGAFLFLSTAGKEIELGQWKTYLRFSDRWGSSRGFTWKRTMIIYNEHYTFFQKLFGCGPDLMGIQYHTYFNEEVLQMMGAYLVDAHNEILQILGTLGFVGVIGYAGLEITSFVRCVKRRRENPLLLAFAAGILGYFAQSMLGSPQTFSTPMLFLVIGIAESLMRKTETTTS